MAEWRQLMNACHSNDVQQVKCLIANKADIHAHNEECLKQTCYYGHADIASILLENKANIHVDNNFCLRWASEHGRVDVVRVLLESNADVHSNNDQPLRWASKFGYIEVTKLLINNKADVNALNNDALRSACFSGHMHVAQLLLEHKGNTNYCDFRLLYWAGQNNVEILKLLILYGANYLLVLNRRDPNILGPRKLMELSLLHERLKTYEKESGTQLLDMRKTLWSILQF